MCPRLAPHFQPFFLLWPLTVLLKQTRQAVHAVKQSILLRCQQLECTLTIIEMTFLTPSGQTQTLDLRIMRSEFYHCVGIIDTKRKNRLLKVCACYQRHIFSLFFFFLLWPLTVLIKQTRQVVCAVKQSILLRCLWLECTLTIIERTSCGCLPPGGSMISVVQFLFCEK